MSCSIKSVELTGRTTFYAVELAIQPPDDLRLWEVDCTVLETHDADCDYTGYQILFVDPEKFWEVVEKKLRPQIIEAIGKKESTDADA